MNYEDAVIWAKQYISDEILSATGLDLTGETAYEHIAPIDRSALDKPAMVSKGFADAINKIYGKRRIQEDAPDLIEQASVDPDAFDQLRFGIAAKILDGHGLPDDVLSWVAGYLSGTVVKPRQKKGAKSKERLHWIIWRTVAQLEEFGLRATRGTETKVERRPDTARDAVAAALRSLGLWPTTYQRVKRICEECDKTANAVSLFDNPSCKNSVN